MPEEYALGDKRNYVRSIKNSMPMFSPDGRFGARGAGGRAQGAAQASIPTCSGHRSIWRRPTPMLSSTRFRRARCMSIEPQIAIDNVAHVYRPPRGKPVLALDDISLQVRPREFVALLGPSGCGKSTLLYLIGGFLPIEKGTITVNGEPVKAPGPDRGIVFQHFALFPWKTVRDNILYGLERQDMPKAERLARAQALHRSGRPQRLRGQLSVATLRRHEAAHRARPHARVRSEHPADGRAVRRARCADPAPDAGGAAAASGSARRRP